MNSPVQSKNFCLSRRVRSACAAGFTLFEVVIATAILTIAFVGLFGTVMHAQKLAFSAEEDALVESGLEQRIDQLRLLEWPDLTSSQTLPTLRSAVAGNDDAVKRTIDDILETMGFLATAATAEKLIGDIVAAGMPPAAASLAFLRLNAAVAGPGPNT